MNSKLMMIAFAIATILSVAGSGAAQEVAMINGIKATRVVIGPAISSFARAIKADLKEQYHNARAGSSDWKDAQGLYYFYGGRNFEPFWLEGDADSVRFSDKALRVIDLFKDARLEGLRPEDYFSSGIDLDFARGQPQALARLEAAFSDAVARYARHAAGGRIRPGDVSPSITLPPPAVNLRKLRTDLVVADDPAKVLRAMHPRHPEFMRLRALLADKINNPADAHIIIPDGKLIRPGQTDRRISLLRERLGLIAADTTRDTLYDAAMVAAVKEFQASIRLVADGIVGPATIAALNGENSFSEQDIVANMERWRWMPDDLGPLHVLVNIPEFRLQIRNGNDLTYETRVVVGTPENKTPVFSDEIEHVVVNPYWNVPYSIATAELLPNAKGNPGYFTSRNFELLSGHRVINASKIDWSKINPRNPPFRIRQRPGRGNALGNIKFLFPNQHAVYLHDTPVKSLFERTSRAFSHGCVRVDRPFEFADALFRQEPALDATTLRAMVGGDEKWRNLKQKVPVHLAYFTLRVDEDGTVRSFIDVYGHDKRLTALLAG